MHLASLRRTFICLLLSSTEEVAPGVLTPIPLLCCICKLQRSHPGPSPKDSMVDLRWDASARERVYTAAAGIPEGLTEVEEGTQVIITGNAWPVRRQDGEG